MGTTLREIMNRANSENLTDGLDLDKAVTGGYAGDLLSDVNANSSAGNVWVTVLTIRTLRPWPAQDLAG